MKLLEFLRITEARQVFFRPTVEPAGGVLLFGQKRQPPKAAIIPMDGQNLPQSSNVLVIRAKVRTGNQLNRELIRRREEDPDWQEAWYGWGRGRVDPQIAERYPQVFNATIIDSPGALFRFMTTDLGMERETYEQIIGPAPDDVGDNAINFHGARLFVPTNMSKRGLTAVNQTLETVYQHLAKSGLDYLFKDTDIRFKKLPTNVGGEYVPSTGDMNVNPSIKNPGQTIYSLLHEFGHMFYYQFTGANTRKAIADKFEDVKMEGEGYAGDPEYFMQLQDAMDKIQPGDTAVYKGRKRAWKQMGKLVVDHVGVAKMPSGEGVPSVWLHRVRENGSTTAAGRVPVQLYLDPKRWETGIQPPEQTPMHQRRSDDWFPTHYSENAPRNNKEGEEWWAELFAYHTLGNLGGEPEAWISKVVDTYRQQLAASVGSSLNESPFAFSSSPRTQKKFQIYMNPDAGELQKMNGELRAYLVGDVLYGWGIIDGIHRDVQRDLGLPSDAIPLYVYTDGKDVSVVVTDSVPPDMNHDPRIANVIRSNGYLNQFNDIEIDYYDSDIVGDWEETMDVGEAVGSNEGEVNSDSEMPPVAHGDEEGNASWDWTDPYHSSGAENAVMSRTP